MPHLKEPKLKLTPCHPAQLFIPGIIPQLEVDARRQRWDEIERKREQRNPKKVIVVKGSASPPENAGLLNPLVESVVEVQSDIRQNNTDLLIENVATVNGKVERYSWNISDEGVVDTHWLLLRRSLERLDAKSSKKERREILEWIFHPDVPEQVVRTDSGREETILIPFTFGTCCRLEGADPEEMREKIRSMCRNNGIVIH